MSLFRPKSIVHLILVGFMLVMLPLVAALLYAVISVDSLANQSQRVVSHAVQATQGALSLVKLVTEMERSVRQYQVLGDKEFFQAYNDSRSRFEETLRGLSELYLPLELERLLEELKAEESEFFTLVKHQRRRVKIHVIDDSFSFMSEKAQRVLTLSEVLIDDEVEKTLAAADQSQQNLLWQTSALAGGALLLTIIFIVLITRPISRMDEAVRRLGSGDFSVPVSLKGPRDLEQLGERLDWMRSRLLEVEEEKVRFLRHISHELKTPLTTIREGAELLREQIAGTLSVRQREITDILRQNSVQLQRLIEDLLNFNTATSRNLVLNLQPVRIDQVVKGVIAEHKLAIMSRRLQFAGKLPEITITADQEKLRVVVDNLLSNSIKFSPTKGKIFIIAKCDAVNLYLEVRDQGPGIPPDQQKKIFEAFYQGSTPHQGHVKGSGLGLSIVREYVQAHGGAIEVVNDGNSVGTCMSVTLPRHQESEA